MRLKRMRSSSNSTPDDSSHGNRQKRETLFKSYLRDLKKVKYQISYQAFEVSCWQTESDQETTRKLFRKPPRDMKHQLTDPFAIASNNSLIG